MTKSDFLALLSDPDVCGEVFEIIRRGGRPSADNLSMTRADFLAFLGDPELCAEILDIIRRGGRAPANINAVTFGFAAANAAALREQVRNRITNKAGAMSALANVSESSDSEGDNSKDRKSTLRDRLQFMKSQSIEYEKPKIPHVLGGNGATDEESLQKYTLVLEKNCPVCGRITKVTTTKTRLIAEISDADLCVHYKNFNPYLYGVYVCENCGYAASQTRFLERMPERVRKAISSFLEKNDFKTPFVEERDKDEALTFFEMAIRFNEMFERSPGRQALLYQKMAWICRIEDDEEQEREYMKMSARLFEESITSERYPIEKVSDNIATYLIGIDYYMLGDIEKATKYLGQIITSNSIRSSAPKLYERARDIWQDIRSAKKK